MRPIEFLAWHQPTARMYPVLMFDDERVYRRFSENETEWEKDKATDSPFDRADCVLLQFTGLTDAVGAKIFEGDVLRSDWLFTPEEEAKGDVSYSSYWHIKYCYGGFCMMSVGCDDPEETDFYSLSEHHNLDEIRIGNRHEHPELMEFTKSEYPLHPDHIRKHEPKQLILEAAL